MEYRANTIYNYILKHLVIPKVSNDTTTDKQLDKFCKRLFGYKFHGVFPSDQIPTLTIKRPYAILNLDKTGMPGSHWIAVAYSRKGTVVYDSFGRKHTKIIPSLSHSGNGPIIDTDYDAEQGKRENNCGARCIAFLMVFDTWGVDLAILI